MQPFSWRLEGSRRAASVPLSVAFLTAWPLLPVGQLGFPYYMAAESGESEGGSFWAS